MRNNADSSREIANIYSDYATWLNLQNNITSTAPLCSYIMVKYFHLFCGMHQSKHDCADTFVD